MQSTSPLGQYAPAVASLVAVGVIAAYLIASIVPGVDPAARTALEVPAAIALGAVFGSAVGVNGWKYPVTAMGAKLDTVQRAVAAIASVPADHPDAGHAIVAAVQAADGNIVPPVAAPPVTPA